MFFWILCFVYQSLSVNSYTEITTPSSGDTTTTGSIAPSEKSPESPSIFQYKKDSDDWIGVVKLNDVDIKKDILYMIMLVCGTPVLGLTKSLVIGGKSASRGN